MQRAVTGTSAILLLSLVQAVRQGNSGPAFLQARVPELEEGAAVVQSLMDHFNSREYVGHAPSRLPSDTKVGKILVLCYRSIITEHLEPADIHDTCQDCSLNGSHSCDPEPHGSSFVLPLRYRHALRETYGAS